MDKTPREYNNAGLIIKDINYDRQLKTLVDLVKYELKVNMNYLTCSRYVNFALILWYAAKIVPTL